MWKNTQCPPLINRMRVAGQGNLRVSYKISYGVGLRFGLGLNRIRVRKEVTILSEDATPIYLELKQFEDILPAD